MAQARLIMILSTALTIAFSANPVLAQGFIRPVPIGVINEELVFEAPAAPEMQDGLFEFNIEREGCFRFENVSSFDNVIWQIIEDKNRKKIATFRGSSFNGSPWARGGELHLSIGKYYYRARYTNPRDQRAAKVWILRKDDC